MPPLGTAPRLIGGVWVTRTGRRLTPAGQRTWNRLHAQGRTDGRGHFNRQPETPTVKLAAPEIKKPGFSTIVAAKAGDRQARKQIVAYGRHTRAKKQAETQTDRMVSAQFGGAEQIAARANKVVNPTAGKVIKALSPYTSAKEAVSAARHGKVGPALVAASGILPVGPGRARSLARAVKAGEEATRVVGTVERGRRTLQVGEKVQQLPRARSKITQATFEHIADTASRKFPEAPVIGAQARVAKHAGRETGLEAERASARMAGHSRTLPKRGSPEDVAHFWWAQLPAKARNVDSLKQVRVHQAAELERIMNGSALADLKKRGAQLAIADLPHKQHDLAVSIAQLDQTIKAAPKVNPRVIRAVHTLSADRQRILQDAGLLTPERAAARRELVSNWLGSGHAGGFTLRRVGATDTFHNQEGSHLTGRILHQNNPAMYDDRLTYENLHDAQGNLAGTIAYDARPDRPKVYVESVYVKPEYRKSLAAFQALTSKIVADGRPIDATFNNKKLGRLFEAMLARARRAPVASQPTVSQYANPMEGPAFIGHRLDTVRSATEPLVPKSPGLGKARLPEGVSRQNKLVRAKTGRVRMSTHVAAEDWRASQNYQQAVRSRDDLAKMGKPFTGVLGKDEMLVNPKGRPIPKEWKTDKLAQLGDNEDAVRKAADEITSGYLADKETAGDLLAQAAEHGVHWNELRVVPKSTVSRYYGQFVPARAASVGGKVYDRAVDATAASIIFGRIGYIPKNVAQNLIMAAPHQGPLLLSNAPRAAQLIPRPGQAEADRHLWDLLSGEVGTGATGALGKEFTSKLAGVPSKITGAVSGVADTPLRISAFLHEASAEGVIPRLNPILREKDKKALLDLLTNPEKRAQLNDIRSRSVEAMADFSRLTPKQRKWARRFLIIPGWLVAGSRYPIHFAATHPIRSGALAYAAAGEPGAPDSLRVNKPINEYFAKDVPSYVQGLDLGGGKVLRTNSLSPVSTPWDILGAIRGKDGSTVADYANPLAAAAWHIGNQELSGPFGSYRTTQKKALIGNLERLVPSEKFARDLISPPKNPRTYPEDTSRIGRLKREVGIFPIRVQGSITGPKKAESEAETLARKLGIGKTLPPAVKKSYTRLQERDNAWKDATHGKKAGTRDYYVAKYKADLVLARKWGYLNAAQVAKAQEWIGHAPVDDIRKAHSALSNEGGIYDKEFTPARETGRWLEAQDSYLSQLDEAVKRGELTKAQAGRARAWARKAERHDIDKARLALERKLMAPTG